MTHQSELHTGDSIWMSRGAIALDCPPLDGDLSCEVVVVGGGITGALVARSLIHAGVETVLVDQSKIGAGSTAASTGLLQYEVDVPLVDLIRQRGERDAVHAYRRGLRAIQELQETIGQLKHDCEFARRSTLYLASRPEDVADVQREHQCRRHFGFDVQYLDRPALAEFAGIEAPAALLSVGDGEVNPYLLTQELLIAAIAKGLRAYGNTRILAVDESLGGVTLATSAGTLRAKQAALCTGYWSHRHLTEDLGTLHSTFAIASQPMSSHAPWPESCLIWETARPYFYARQTRDGRVIAGGEDSPFADDHFDESLLAEKGKLLTERFERMFPNLSFTPARVWGGTIADTHDGLPFIGLPLGRHATYFALGYGGNGITFSTIAARLITDLILRRPNEDQQVFRFGR